MKVLTTIQIEFITLLGQTPLQSKFYLTGGTALSAFYLHHRYSEDLDFFTDQEGNLLSVLPELEKLSKLLKAQLEIKRNFRTFLEVYLNRGEELVRCDFALDSPYRLEPTILNSEYGIYIDNILDMACNKLSALFDRSDIKDFVDIFFIDREIIQFEKLLEKAKKKHIGMDDYWLATSLVKIENFDFLPRMIKPVSEEELKEFFRQKAVWLMSDPDN